MREHKIIILGPMGAGKSTAIRSIVDGVVVSTDVRNTEVNPDKATTTVALDYGDVPLPNGDRLRLFGTPGQDRFDFLWGSLAKGAVGGVILMDARTASPSDEILRYLSVLKEKTPDLPVVVGVTKADLVDQLQLAQFKQSLAAAGYHLPLIICDAREKNSVMMLMDMLMCEIETQALLGQML